MRRIIVAPSFDADVLKIASHIEETFGVAAADAFDARLRRLTETLAHAPRIGTVLHGFATPLYGIVLFPNWIFYSFTESELRLLHIRDGRRERAAQTF